MSTASESGKPPSTFGEPAWDVARLFPAQGHWSEEEYLDLNTNHYVEFSDGCIEVLGTRTMSHQEAVGNLALALAAFVRSGDVSGTALFGPLPVRLRPGKYREPAVLFMLAAHAERMGERFWDGADLVMEVVSDDRVRDLETKRREYALAGIPEYWIVDPLMKRITVLALAGDAYAVHGEFSPGETAASRLLPGFSVAVADALAAGQ